MRVSGPKSQIRNLNPHEVVPFVKVMGLAEGAAKMTVLVDVPPHMSVLRIEPAEVGVVRSIEATVTPRDAKRQASGAASKSVKKEVAGP